MSWQPEPAGPGGGDARQDAIVTVEQVVRRRLAEALGGGRGVAESAVPTLAFTVTWLTTKDMKLSIGLGIALTVVLLLVRLVQRSNPQFVLNALVGIGFGALFAYVASRSGGSDEDVARAVFTPGLIVNAVSAFFMIVSIATRWPLVGFLVGSIADDPTEWHRDPAIVKLSTKLTWVLVAPCILRLAVQLPLWLDHQIALLGVTKIGLGWPLQLATFAVMAWMLTRDKTPIDPDDTVL
ncbi:MAG: DUF3159 domain-containing protein [Aeromicrobium erythreum]